MLYNYDNKHVGHSLVAGGRLVPIWVPPRGNEVAPHRRLLPRAFLLWSLDKDRGYQDLVA